MALVLSINSLRRGGGFSSSELASASEPFSEGSSSPYPSSDSMARRRLRRVRRRFQKRRVPKRPMKMTAKRMTEKTMIRGTA
jgi:hypothetical protein